MKKIVHVVESFGGGVYYFLRELCNGLADEFELVIIYSERKETPKNFKKDFNPKIKFIKVNMCRGFNPYINIQSFFQIKKFLKKEDPDIIHLHSSKAGFLGRLACYFNGFNMENVYYNPHGFSFLQQNESKIKRKLYLYLEKFAANLGGYIIGCSKGEYEEAKKISNKSLNINNGIDIEEIDKIIIENNIDKNIYKNNKKITIGTVGRICPQKNPILFNEIANNFPQYDFVWIGDGELKHELKSKNIRITGWLERIDVIKELLKLNIFILTSEWEGLPLSLLEAMYLEKPVIVSNVIGNKDVIINNENGYLCNDLSDFKKILLNYNNNKISNSAKNHIINFYSLKIMKQNYFNLYMESKNV
ncbi:glycosyltransferase [Caloramator sp. E03]|uniref:glycosyltransferase n=1 Tax=Caloramator sp. E03 TaxID=2576307 RepID=UPI001110CC7C|nr:glycosyltransferase [Caloramator sp. E03]QCX34369.1 glycosyltransferase [Caloramator sp. E03]